MSFTCNELMEISKKTIADLLENDPWLSDLPKDITLEEVTAQLALQHGQSMTVYLNKDNGEVLPIVVPVGARLLELKRGIRRATTLLLRRAGHSPRISWRYVWRNNALVYEGVCLDDDNAKLGDLGLTNKSHVSFVKKLRSKNILNPKKT